MRVQDEFTFCLQVDKIKRRLYSNSPCKVEKINQISLKGIQFVIQ